MVLSQHRFEVLDGLRGIAALMVMVLHFNQQYHYPFLNNIYLAVDVFFVLSGFVVSHAYADKLAKGMRNFEYVVRRIARLFPLVALGALLGFFALVLQSASGLNGMTYGQDVTTSLLNAMFIPYLNGTYVDQAGQQAIGLIFPGNSPMWSIFFELVASLLFIKFARISSNALGLVFLFCVALLIIVPFILGTANFGHPVDINAGWNTDNFLLGFPRVVVGFVSGMLVYRFWSSSKLLAEIKLPNILRHAAWPCLILILILLQPWTLKGAFGLIVVVMLAPLLVAFGAISKLENPILARALTFLGWLSFPIYCLHEPILTITRILYANFGLQRSLYLSADYCAFVVVCVVTLSVAILLEKLDVQRKLIKFILALRESVAKTALI